MELTSDDNKTFENQHMQIINKATNKYYRNFSDTQDYEEDDFDPEQSVHDPAALDPYMPREKNVESLQIVDLQQATEKVNDPHKPRLNQKWASSESVKSKDVDLLIIGGGPAALGLLINAFKSNRQVSMLKFLKLNLDTLRCCKETQLA